MTSDKPRPLPSSIGLATLGLLALPLYAVQRLPWRDPMGPAAAWTTLGVYVAIAAAGVWWLA
jgi:hypothetical protein